MNTRLRAHVRSNIVGYIALAVAIMGVPTAWAISRNSIGAPQIKPNAVGKSEIRKNAVRTGEVANGSLRRKDFGAGQLPEGPRGPAGAPGTARAYAVVDPSGCTTAPGSCTIFHATNVVGARRPQPGFFCVTVGPGIDRLTAGSMAGVEWEETAGPEGEASAAPYPRDYIGASVCPGQEFTVATMRGAAPADDVAVWFAVP